MRLLIQLLKFLVFVEDCELKCNEVHGRAVDVPVEYCLLEQIVRITCNAHLIVSVNVAAFKGLILGPVHNLLVVLPDSLDSILVKLDHWHLLHLLYPHNHRIY